MSSSVTGVGSVYKLGNGAALETFTAVGEVVTMTGPEISSDEIEVSSHDSVASASGYKEFINGQLDAGNITLELNWTNSAIQHTLRDTVGGAITGHELVYGDGTVATVTGFVMAVSFSADPSKQITMSVTIRMTSAWVFTVLGALQVNTSGGVELFQVLVGGVPTQMDVL